MPDLVKTIAAAGGQDQIGPLPPEGDSGYNAVVTADLQKLLNIGTPLSFSAGYQYYGPNFYAPYGGAEADRFGNESIYPGNAQGLTVGASWTALPP